MKKISQVHGTQEKVLPLEINVDTVYIRENIQPDEEGWIYDETQMSLLEYFRQSIPQTEETTDKAIAELSLLFLSFNERLTQLEGQNNV